MSEQNYWTRTAGRRLSRRGMLRGTAVAGLGLAGAALIGCGDDDDDEAAAPAAAVPTTAAPAAGTPAVAAPDPGAPVSGGTAVTNLSVNPIRRNQDPHSGVWTVGYTWGTHSMLVRMDSTSVDRGQWTIDGDAADTWEQPDDTSYVFHLADNLNYHNLPPANGRAATSEDVKWSIERLSTPEPEYFRRQEFESATITTPDERTAVLTFPTPQAAFWTRITTPGTSILPPEIEPTLGENGLILGGELVPGTGPFIHVGEYEREQFLHVERNPDYFKPGLPYLDRFEGWVYPSRDAEFVAFRGGDIDVTRLNSVDQYEDAEGIDGVTVDARSSLSGTWMVLNIQNPPFDDVRVRRALSLAYPRQEQVDIVHAGGRLGMLQGPGGLTPGIHGTGTYSAEALTQVPGYRSGAGLEEDLVEARSLLDAAGIEEYTANLPFFKSASQTNFFDPQVILLQDAYRKIGVNFTLEPHAYSELLVLFSDRSFDWGWTAQNANGLDANEYFGFYFMPGAARNYGDWEDPKFVSMYEAQDVLVDEQERNAKILEMVQYLDEMAIRPAGTLRKTLIAYRDRLRGWHGYNNTAAEVYPHTLWLDA